MTEASFAPRLMHNTILNVHHDSAVRRSLSHALREAGYRVREASAAKEAVDLALELWPGVVLLPVELPGLGVAQFLSAFDAPDRLPPLVVCTGADEGTDEEFEALRAGAVACLPGGARPELVVARVGAVLRAMVRRDPRLVEESLRASEERLRSILENMSEGLMLFDADENLVYQNPASLRIHGFAPNADGTIDRGHLPETWSAWDEAGRAIGFDEWPVSRVFRGERFENQVLRVVRNETGLEFFGSYNGCPIVDRDGKLTLGFITIRDITGQVRVQQALEDKERRLRTFFESDMMGAIYWTTEGRISGANDKFLQMVGYTREDLETGRLDWSRMTPPEHKALDERALRELRATGVDTPYEKDYIRKDGTRVPILIGAAMLDDTWREGVAFVLDITKRRRAEEALREADRRKNEFIAILSHELRNPLAPIRYALPLLDREALRDAGKQAVAVIDRQVAHLVRLVDDLLDISRITAGKIELRCENVTLSSVLGTAIEAASPAIVAARHHLEVRAPKAVVWLYADAPRMSQAVTNLLNNSAKYTPPGGRIVLTATVESGDLVVIRVEDNGVGISADSLPSVFEMFSQANSGHRSQGGLGIGLTLARQLVSMHGGTIEARSAGEGQGSEFVIRLPLARAQHPLPQASDASEDDRGVRLRVLVVDDNVDLVEMLAVMVESSGHDVRKAFDGPSAVSEALAFRPDVVLLDVGMPGMDGMEVARELRSHAVTAGARIVALTGWGQAEDRRRTSEAGFDEHLTKPTEPQQVQRILADAAARLGVGPRE